MLRVDVDALNRLLCAKGWTLENLWLSTDDRRPAPVSRNTARRMMKGGPTRMSTLKEVAKFFGVGPIDLIDRSEYERPQEAYATAQKTEATSEWMPGQAITEVRTTSNGLQYRLFRMQHRHQRTRFGRGKRYEFAHLSDDAQNELKCRLIRHTEVCDRIGRHPQFPICYATYPESKDRVWWVIDEWVDGRTLAERLAEGRMPIEQAAQWACELAGGLAALHHAGIVRRELNPDNLLVRESDGTLLLTDFELAKLSGSLPTVSQAWPDDPYRAPEVGAGEITPAADFYSWGRIVTHLIAGELPPRSKEADVLVKRVPKAVLDIIGACTAQRQSQRPPTFADVLPVMKSWRQSIGGQSLSKEASDGT